MRLMAFISGACAVVGFLIAIPGLLLLAAADRIDERLILLRARAAQEQSK